MTKLIDQLTKVENIVSFHEKKDPYEDRNAQMNPQIVSKVYNSTWSCVYVLPYLIGLHVWKEKLTPEKTCFCGLKVHMLRYILHKCSIGKQTYGMANGYLSWKEALLDKNELGPIVIR